MDKSLMEFFTKLPKDVLEGYASLHILARQVRIGPRHMRELSKHTAYNVSAMTVVCMLIFASIQLYAPFVAAESWKSVVAFIIAFTLLFLVGFAVNLVEPAENVFAKTDPEAPALNLANQWTTYFLINFTTVIIFYLLINVSVSVADADGRSASGFLIAGGLSYEFAVFTTISISTTLATITVFTICKRAGKILDGFFTAFGIFVFTNIFCGSLFYIIQYKLSEVLLFID